MAFPGCCRGNLVLLRPIASSHCEFKLTKVELTETSQRDFGVGFSIYATSFKVCFSIFFFSVFFFSFSYFDICIYMDLLKKRLECNFSMCWYIYFLDRYNHINTNAGKVPCIQSLSTSSGIYHPYMAGKLFDGI